MDRKCRKLIVILTLLYVLPSPSKSADTPETNPSHLEKLADFCAEKCECKTHLDLFIFNCTNRDFHNTLSNWPDHENKTLRASFSYNHIKYLVKFPRSNSSAMLALDHCGIETLDAGLFENMKYIKYVDLSHNLITTEELSAEKFKGPYDKNEGEPIDLEHLNVAYNQLHSLSSKLFENLPKLKFLNLEGNKFEVLDKRTQEALNSIKNLEHLNLAYNGLREIPDGVFTSLTNLLEFNLCGNNMTYVPSALGSLTNLEVLILDSNPIYELLDESFNGLPNLVELSLNNLTNVVEIHSNTFAPLKKLRKLQLSNNRDLEIFEPDAFGPENYSTPIRELYMNNNNLIDIPAVLIDWSGLHVFEFNDNPLLCTCNLYNITKCLNTEITRLKAGPYCIGQDEISFQVYSLDSRVCDEDYIASLSFRNDIQSRFSVIRISLITMSLVAITATFIAAVVCFAKQRKYGFFGHNFSRSTTVLYNPLDRQPTM